MAKRVSKKGMELSLNTIIIAVIVIIVLVSVVAFFLFGFKGLSDRVKIVFFGVTAGSSKQFAMQQCQNYCQQAELMPESARKTSPYCNYELLVDDNNDGEADFTGEGNAKKYVKWHCYFGNDNDNDNDNDKYLGVGCTVKVGGTTETPKYLENG